MDVYFRNKGYTVKPVPVRHKTRCLSNMAVPKIDHNVTSIDRHTYQEIYEFLGATACGIDLLV